MDSIVGESQINAEVFDEFDPNEENGIVLRTLIDFKIVDDNGQLVDLDELGKSGVIVHCEGTVVEPLPYEIRQSILKYASTICSSQIEVDEFLQLNKTNKDQEMEVEDNSTIPSGKQVTGVLNRENFRVGDSLDSYCNKTFKWYTSKVCDVDHERRLIKVHFQGWNAKHDEWLPFESERLVALGCSSEVVAAAAATANQSVPWFEHEKLQQKALSMYNAKRSTKYSLSVGDRKTQQVRIEGIEDFCVDFTYANPTLWLISNSGVWYRIAGALTLGGYRGQPQPEYKLKYKTVSEKYFVTSHVVMCLLDVIPANHLVSLAVIVAEAAVRSNEAVTEVQILTYYEFILEQVLALELPVDWNLSHTLEKSTFVKQLRQEGVAFHAQGGIHGLIRLENQKSSSRSKSGLFPGDHGEAVAVEKGNVFNSKRRQALIKMYFSSPEAQTEQEFLEALYDEEDDDDDFINADELPVRDDTTAYLNSLRKEQAKLAAQFTRAQSVAPCAMQSQKSLLELLEAELDANNNAYNSAKKTQIYSNVKIKYPIEDEILWRIERKKNLKVDLSPQPLPQKSRQFDAPFTSVSNTLLETYNALVNMRFLLNLPYFTVDSFQQLLTGRFGGSAEESSDAVVHPALTEMHVKLLSAIIKHHLNKKDKTTTTITATAVGEGGTGFNLGSDVNMLANSVLMLPNIDSPGDTGASGSSSTSSVDVIDSFLRTGDTWVETLRVLVLEQLNLLPPVPPSQSINTVSSAGGQSEKMDVVATTTNADDSANVAAVVVETSSKAVDGATPMYLEQYLDPIQTIHDIITQSILTDPEAISFAHPVDPVLCGLPDYFDIVKEPMDLSTVLYRIETAWYDVPSTVPVGAAEADAAATMVKEEVKVEGGAGDSVAVVSMGESGHAAGSASLDVKTETKTETKDSLESSAVSPYNDYDPTQYFVAGTLIDVYCELIGKWIEAHIKEINFTNHTMTVRYCGWGSSDRYDEVLPFGTDKLLPHKSVSLDNVRKRMTSDELQEKFPHLFTTVEQGLFPARPLLISKKSKGQGHLGVVYDMRLIFANCELYHGRFYGESGVNLLVESSQALSAIFEREYHNKVEQPLARLAAQRVSTVNDSPALKMTTNSDNNEALSEVDVETTVLKRKLKTLLIQTNEDFAYENPVSEDEKSTFAVETRDPSPETVWSEMIVASVGNQDYASFSPALRLQLLHWLTTEFLATTQCKAYLEEVNEQHIAYRQEKRANARQKAREAAELEQQQYEESVYAASQAQESSSSSVNGAAGKGKRVGRPKAETTKHPRRPYKSKRSCEILASAGAGSVANSGDGSDEENGASAEGTNDGDDDEMETNDDEKVDEKVEFEVEKVDFQCLTIRNFSIGRDRFNNQYWTFHSDPIRPSIYVELSTELRKHLQTVHHQSSGKSTASSGSGGRKSNKNASQSADSTAISAADLATSQWIVYSNVYDIAALLNWLSDKGIHENALKKSIFQWVEKQDLVLPVLLETVQVVEEVEQSKQATEPSQTITTEIEPATEGMSVENPDGMDSIPDGIIASVKKSARKRKSIDIDYSYADYGLDLDEIDRESKPKRKYIKKSKYPPTSAASLDGGDGGTAGEMTQDSLQDGDGFDETADGVKKKRKYVRRQPLPTNGNGGNGRMSKRDSFETMDASQLQPQETETQLEETRLLTRQAMETRRQATIGHHATDFSAYWQPNECADLTAVPTATPLFLCMQIKLPDTYQLGMGVKELHGKVYVTSFKYTDADKMTGSAAKDAGIRIGDQIVATNGTMTKNIPNLIAEMKASVAAATAPVNMDATVGTARVSSRNTAAAVAQHRNPVIYMLVARHASVQSIPSFMELLAKEPDVMASIESQTREDTLNTKALIRDTCSKTTENTDFTSTGVVNVQLSSAQTPAKKGRSSISTATITTTEQSDVVVAESVLSVPYKHSLLSQNTLPNRVLSSFLNALLKCNHNYCVSTDWMEQHLPAWISQITNETFSALLNNTEGGSATVINKTSNKTSRNEEKQLLRLLVACLMAFEKELFNSKTALPEEWVTGMSAPARDITGAKTAAAGGVVLAPSVSTAALTAAAGGAGTTATAAANISSSAALQIIEEPYNRDRAKWLLYTSHITTFAQFSYCLSILLHEIKWPALSTAIAKAAAITATTARHVPCVTISREIYRIGSVVMYYPSGFSAYQNYTDSLTSSLNTVDGAAGSVVTVGNAATSTAEASSSSTSLVTTATAGATDLPIKLSTEGLERGYKCIVSSIQMVPSAHAVAAVASVTSAGGSGRQQSSQQSAPHTNNTMVQFTLTTTAPAPHDVASGTTLVTALTTTSKPTTENGSIDKTTLHALSRLFLRILTIVKKNNRVRQFLHPLDGEYEENVPEEERPMDLTTMLCKAHNLQYTTIKSFLADLHLIHDTCRLHVVSDYKKLMNYAQDIVNDGRKLVALMKPEFDALNLPPDIAKVEEGGDSAMDTETPSITTELATSTTPVVKNGRGRPRKIVPESAAAMPKVESDNGVDGIEGEATSPVKATEPPLRFTFTVPLHPSAPLTAMNTTTVTSATTTACIVPTTQFLLPYERYLSTVNNRKQELSLECLVKYVGFQVGTHSPVNALGTVIGNKPAAQRKETNGSGDATPFLPWDYLEIEWHDNLDRFMPRFVCPWEVEVIATAAGVGKRNKFDKLPKW